MFSLKALKLLSKHIFNTNLIAFRLKSQLNSYKLRQFLSESHLKLNPLLMTTYQTIENELQELKTIEDNDKELKDLVDSERRQLTDRLTQLVDSIISESIVDDSDIIECYLDLNCGVGGQEAMLFTKELFAVYMSLCEHQSWKCSAVSNDCDTDFGGSRHSSAIISGLKCYQLLRHEAGVHRVQRYPKTDRHRVHTSTTTVAVIPVRHNLIEVKEKDLVFQMKTSQGAGGQHVNKTLTCVRVTHTPTGVTTECQETRSQIFNKEIALKKLNAILNQNEYERRRKEEMSAKRAQVGIASRSDKIRTYNFPQNRITDHRLNDSIHEIDDYMNGSNEKVLYFLEKLENQRKNQLKDKIRDNLNQYLI